MYFPFDHFPKSKIDSKRLYYTSSEIQDTLKLDSSYKWQVNTKERKEKVIVLEDLAYTIQNRSVFDRSDT